MKILVINCGSSTLKFQLIDMKNENVLAKGNVEKIGEHGSFLKYQLTDGEKLVFEQSIEDHSAALKLAIDTLLDQKIGAIENTSEITAIGHRVVHGGETFSSSTVINDEVIKAIEENVELAPIHNPPNLMGIRACKNIMPNTPMVAVFDTAFHQTMPKEAYIYPIPYDIYKKYKVRKYGFHGTSHQYVAKRAAEFLGKDINNLKIVTCHLGSGASVCAVKYGKSIETSMGFTPLAGLAMGTRCGDIDPAIVTFIMKKENLSIEEVDELLNKKSGVMGISQISNDFRDLEDEYMKGNEAATLAIDVFVYDVKKYISICASAMGGIDVLVFTAGVGETSEIVRGKAAEGMEFLGIEIDAEKNKVHSREMDISKDGAKVRTLIIPTNEELMIAKETERLV